MVPTYPEARNELVSAANSVDYAYPETAEGPVPLVLLQHFRAAEPTAWRCRFGAAGLLSLVQNARGTLELGRGCQPEAYEQLRICEPGDAAWHKLPVPRDRRFHRSRSPHRSP